VNSKININLDFKKKVIKKNFFLSKLFIKYQNAYLGKNYKIEDFFFANDNLIYIPFTSNKNDEKINYFFYSFPATIYSEKQLNFSEFKIVVKNFINKFFSQNIEYNFLMTTNYEELSKIDLKATNPVSVEELQIINLNLDENKIFQNIRPNHKNIIRKMLKDNNVEFRIYDYKNYLKELMVNMMKMHEVVSGRKTRSLSTWNINEEMILKKMAFIVEVLFKKKIISYSFFYHNLEECCYFSSVTMKDSFELGGINHTSLWHAIKFAKNLGLKRMKLGTTKYLYVRNENSIDIKKKNIAFFKSRFCGETQINITIDKQTNIES
jgi:hypothetical protein